MRASVPTGSTAAGPTVRARRSGVAVYAVLVAVVLGVILTTATGGYADGGNGGSITINVTVPKHSSTTGSGGGSGGLPRTGADVIGLLVVAGALIGGGVMLTVAGRRRRHG
jgi:LPXTG-motif cell wall-anchored protein